MPFRYACREYPGMGDCPGVMIAATRDEVLRLAELHAQLAHGEAPDKWSADERATVVSLIRPADGQAAASR